MADRRRGLMQRVHDLNDFLQENVENIPYRIPRGPHLNRGFTVEEDEIILSFMMEPSQLHKLLRINHFASLARTMERERSANELLRRAQQLLRPIHETYVWNIITGRMNDPYPLKTRPEYPSFKKVIKALRYYNLQFEDTCRPRVPYVNLDDDDDDESEESLTPPRDLIASKSAHSTRSSSSSSYENNIQIEQNRNCTDMAEELVDLTF